MFMSVQHETITTSAKTLNQSAQHEANEKNNATHIFVYVFLT